jgi:hypothetical protein
MQLARNGLGIDFFRLQEMCRTLPGLGWCKQLPGLGRGVQTWVLLGLPLAAGVVACYLLMKTNLFYFLIPQPKTTNPHLAKAATILPDIFVCIMIAGGYIFAPGFLAEALVTERETKVRNLLAVMGVNPVAYWLGHGAADLTLLSLPVAGTWIALRAYNVSDFLHRGLDHPNSGAGLFFVLQAIFVFELIAYSYAFSHAFTSSAYAMALIPAATVGLLVLPILVVLLTAYADISIHTNAKDQIALTDLVTILMMSWAAMSPQGFLIASAILDVFPHQYSNPANKHYFVNLINEKKSPMWGMILLSVGKTVAFALLAWYLDVKHLLPLKAPSAPFHTPPEAVAALDDDVRAEHELINPPAEDAELGSFRPARPQHAIEYCHLRKVYPNAGTGRGVTVAVRDTNFHVEQGECFGLLGYVL